MAKFDPFLSLECAPTPSTLAQSKERKGSNFAIWQHCVQSRTSKSPPSRMTSSRWTRPLLSDDRWPLALLPRLRLTVLKPLSRVYYKIKIWINPKVTFDHICLRLSHMDTMHVKNDKNVFVNSGSMSRLVTD